MQGAAEQRAYQAAMPVGGLEQSEIALRELPSCPFWQQQPAQKTRNPHGSAA